MNTFVVPDVHGRVNSLRLLLEKAGIIDAEGNRFAPDFDTLNPDDPFWSPIQVVSIGDLANGTLVDQNNDAEILLRAADWFDKLILGNHESGYLFDNMGFNGYYAAPPVKAQYNKLFRDGFVVPCVRIGNTLLSHAGVHEYFAFATAQDAEEAILDVWENYHAYSNDMEEKFYFQYERQQIEIPKALLLDGVSSKRGGGSPIGGFIWADWAEKKNTNFSQVMGHTPIKIGPVETHYLATDVFHLNIDAGAKGGLNPCGVWLDDDGEIIEFVGVE